MAAIAVVALAVVVVLFTKNISITTDTGAVTLAQESGDAFAVALNPERNYRIVVNDNNAYQFGGEYDKALQKDIVYMPDCYGELTPLESAASSAFQLLQYRLLSQGTDIRLFSGYRTKEDQQWVYDYYSNLEGWSDTNKVAKPGFSEHHTGLLLNIVLMIPDEEHPGEYIPATETAERQLSDPRYKPIHENLADFGFIDRYPAGKEDITGTPCEPYEIRFVGSSKIAHEIMDNNLCLEEYLGIASSPTFGSPTASSSPDSSGDIGALDIFVIGEYLKSK